MEKKQVKQMVMDENGNLGVYAISFVDMPAIESDFVFLSRQHIQLESTNEEKRMVYGAVLIPDKLILRAGKDGEDDYYIQFPKETVRAAAYAFMKQGNQHEHTLQHAMKVAGCTVVESWIKEADDDKSKALTIDVPVGTWLVGIKVDNDSVWEQVKAGEVKGFSIEGFFDTMEKMSSLESQILEEARTFVQSM